MSDPFVAAQPDWSLRERFDKMQAHNIRHLLVADEQLVIIGVTSATDPFAPVAERGCGNRG